MFQLRGLQGAMHLQCRRRHEKVRSTPDQMVLFSVLLQGVGADQAAPWTGYRPSG